MGLGAEFPERTSTVGGHFMLDDDEQTRRFQRLQAELDRSIEEAKLAAQKLDSNATSFLHQGV